ncbi:MAG: hypothetical protein WC613_01320 [Candidatus Aenigmatarchaeota archaeon]
MKKKKDMGIRLLDMFVRMQSEYPDISPDRVLIIEIKLLKYIVTPARTEIMEAIQENRPNSVGELVKLVNRPQESVSRDLTILNNYGVLDFVKKGNVRKPIIEKDIIAVQC